MINNSRDFRSVLLVALTFVGLVYPCGLAQAEPVIISSPTEASANQGYTPTWLPEAEHPAPELGSVPTRGPGTRAEPSRLLSENQQISNPSLQPAENRSGLSNSLKPSEVIATANWPETQRDAQDPGFRETVKEDVRPLHLDLAESGVADTYRDLRTELTLKKEQIFGHSEVFQGSANAGQGSSEGTTWGVQGNQYGSDEPPRTAAQIERDNISASLMMAKFIDDAKPWVFGLIAVYALVYLIKFVIAFGKYQATRRYRRGQRHRQI